MVKKVLFLMTMSLGMMFPSMAQNIPSYVPTNGLVGWWPFNGNANDESGNGNYGTLGNGVFMSTDRFNLVNSAFNFSGSGNISLNNLPTTGNQDFTITGWVKTNNTTTRKGIACWGQDTPWSSTYFFITNTGYLNFGFAYNGGPQSPTFIADNNWHFVGVTNKNGLIQLYLDGSPTGTPQQMYPNINGVNKALGANIDNSGSQNFIGSLDDIAIYNRALTQQEITALYTATPPCTNPNAQITPQGNTTFCQGGFVNLNASTGANYTYQWYNNGQIINGATASIYQANTAGNYTVKVMDGTCNTTSSATTIVVNQYPSSNVQISGNTTICEGSTVTLTAQGSGSYLWSNGSISQSIKVNQTGSYNVAVTQNGCTSNSSSTSITVNPNPTASITPQGNTTFCQGGFVNLVANGGTSYQWNTGSSNSTISANQSGTYTVNVFNSFGCQASASQVVVVNSNPIIAFNGLNDYTLKTQQTIQLIGSPSGGNFVGDGINGATFNPANITLGKKMITYTYTSPQGCKGSATRSTIIVDSVGNVCNVTKYDTITVKNNVYDTIKITKYDTITVTNNVTKYDTILKLKFKLTTGINAIQMTSMTLYPNPTTDVLYIEIGDAKALDGYRYRIIDAVGKEVYNQLVKNTKTEIPLKSLGAAGMYLFEVIDQQNKTIQSNKIVLE